MIHCPWATMAGTADDLENTAATLRGIERRYCSTYAARSGMAEAEVMRMMRAETWLDGRAGSGAWASPMRSTAPLPVPPLSRGRCCNSACPHGGESDGQCRPQADTDTGATRPAAAPPHARRQQAGSAAIPKRDEEDRERGARMRRRYEMQAMVEAIKADDRAVDAAERAANRERQQRDYYYNWQGVPHGQRR